MIASCRNLLMFLGALTAIWDSNKLRTLNKLA
jgi:hypothetical protein